MTSRFKIASLQFRFLVILFLLLIAWSVFSQASIVAMEYYLDSDPGVGNGMAISITSGVNQDVDISINTSGLLVGFHELVVRARYSDGTWGVQESQVFYVSQSSVSSGTDVDELEYFFDTDPGVGNGTTISVTAAQSIDVLAMVTASSLSPGFHTLHVRALNSDGIWGIHQSSVLYIDNLTATGTDANLTGIEYFIDSDPGIGAGTVIPVSPAQASIDQDVSLATSTLPNGNYTMGMRVVNGGGGYSLTQTASFQICTGATTDFSATTICAGEATDFTDLSTDTMAGDIYSWDFDNDGTEDDNTEGNTTFTYPTAGTYTAVLTIDRAGCAVSKEVSVTVESVPVANAGSDQTITADNTVMAANSAGVGETGTWTVTSGTATISEVNNPTTAVTGIVTGQTTLRWTIVNDVASCSSFDEVIITRNSDLSAETDILSFSLTEQSSPAEINTATHTVSILVELDTDLTSLTPTITVSDGAIVSPMGAQNFANTVTYTVTAEDGVTAQDWAVTVSERPLGIDITENIQVYPNPTRDRVFIAFSKQEYNVSVSDLSGRVILNEKNAEELTLKNLSNGTYLLTIESGGESKSVRIIKSN